MSAKRRTYTLLACAVALVAVVLWWVWPSSEAEPQPTGGEMTAQSSEEGDAWGEVMGVVYEVRTDEPVRGATVRVRSGKRETVSTTDANGEFQIRVSERTVTLRAEAAGLRSGGRDDDGLRVAVPKGSNLERVQVFLYEPAALAGRVTHNGEPVEASVMAWVIRDASGAEGYEFQTVTTGAEGTFRVDGLPPNRVVLRVVAEGFAPFESAAADIYAGDTVDMGDLELLSGARVAGTVYERGAESPLPGARLRIRHLEPRGQELATRSNEDGDFTFYGVPEGQVEISIDAPGYRAGAAKLTLGAGEERTFDIELEPLSGIIVQVVDGAGRIVSGARVEVRSALDSELVRTYPVEDGDVLIDDLEGGPFTIRAHQESTGLEAVGVASAGDTLVLTLAATGGIRGLVLRSDGSVASDARVRLLSIEADGSTSVYEDWQQVEGGRFEFVALQPTTFQVEASAAEHRDTLSETIIVEDRSTSVTLRLERAGELFGQVLDGPTGGPVAGASVRLESSRNAVQTDDLGYYQLSSFPSGRHTIMVGKAGYRAELVSGIEIAPGQRLERNVVLELAEEGAELSVVGIGTRLQNQDGRIVVVEPIEGGAAQRAGLRAGDAVVAVDGVTADELGFAAVLEAIRGEEATGVTLLIDRGGSQFELTVQRETVVFEGR